MINEIINWTKWVIEDNPEILNREELTEGLHILIELNKKGECTNYQSYIHHRDKALKNLGKTILEMEGGAEALGENKGIVDKVIFSNNPYSIFFKIFFTAEKKKDDYLKFSKEIEKHNKKGTSSIQLAQKIFSPIANKKLTERFKKISLYYHRIMSDYYNAENDTKELARIEQIKNFCEKELTNRLLHDENFLPGLILAGDSEQTAGEGPIKMTTKYLDKEIRISFKAPATVRNNAISRYLSAKLFNKEDYNINYKGNTYGLSNFLNGDNVKKPFLKHRSAPFLVNNLISAEDAQWLYQFQTIQNVIKLPNPLPIFIDEKELNSEVIRLFRSEGKLRFSEILSALYNTHKHDLCNYYLLNRSGGVIHDFDFVSQFRYKLDLTINDFFGIGHDEKINNIFQFEATVIQRLFANQLVTKIKDSYFLKYFDEDKSFSKTADAIRTLIYKYRRSIYEYIYKSRNEAISANAFREICLGSILEDLRHDRYQTPYGHTKELSIKQKLNIYFSLNHNFDIENNNFGGMHMPSKIPELEKRIYHIAVNDTAHIESDEEFAFAAGQLIYYLLAQSETANRTHAMLEPFIQKHEISMFKKTIQATIARYKHALIWYGTGKGPFEKLASEVLAFDSGKPITEITSLILAGYFARSIIFLVFSEKKKLKGEENEQGK